jgi:ABC-type multidrug transport system fused ATPase/permease subunit
MPEEKKADLIPFSKKVRAVARHISRYRHTLTIVSLLGLFSAAANGTVPLLVGRFFDALLTPQGALSLFGLAPWETLLGLWVLVQLVANGTDWIIGRISRRLGTTLQAQFVIDAYSRLLTLPISFFKTQKTGEISDLVSRTSWMLDSIVAGVLINLAPQFLSIAVGIGIAFYLKPLLACVLLIGVALYVVTVIRLVQPVAGMQSKANRMWRQASGNVHDAYTNFQTVKQAGTEQFENKRATNAFFGAEGAATVWNKVEMYWNNLNASQRLLVIGTQIAIFLLSVGSIMHGTMTIGDLIAFNAYAGFVFGPFVALGAQWQTVQNGLTAAAQSEVIFETESEAYELPGAPSLESLTGSVEFKDVRFSYGEGQGEVLKGVSFEARPGQTIALVGETGAGKSTTAELISGYHYATDGSVLIDGHDIRSLALGELRSHIAIVPQEVVLFNASIKDNIRYGRPDATDEEVKRAAERAHADAFIAKFPQGYEQEVGERGIKLSVGQKQRVAIARAMLRDPRILILDEPTSALDAETERYITRSLEELMRGRTTFIIAHRLSTVRKASQILVLKDGVIAERGTHQELVEIPDGIYRRLYEFNIGLHA